MGRRNGMRALVLEKQQQLRLGEYPIEEQVGDDDVRIQIKSCGICGSDIHYYLHGRIGDFVVEEPMILGHEASGVVTEVGSHVHHLHPGDRVCMEPGIPDLKSKETLSGQYNIDPSVRFWATPPIHGCLRENVVHPAMFCFPISDAMSFGEGAMIEPLSIGMEAAKQAAIQPGDVAFVNGAGTIGIMTALSALAGGCSSVIIADVKQAKLDIAGRYRNIIPVNSAREDVRSFVQKATRGNGADRLFECSGFDGGYPSFLTTAAPGATAVLVGIPGGLVPLDVGYLQKMGITIKTVFRYVNEYPKAIAQVASGNIDVKPLISKVFPFDQAVSAYEFAAAGHEDVVKVMINL